VSRIVQVGDVEGHAVYGYAPEPPMVPAQFRLVERYGRIDLVCDRDDCGWEPTIDLHDAFLTEVVARAVEHVQEVHR
jgi:hypothetical protein